MSPQNSDDQSLTRNTALFSFLFHWSSILGNLVIVHFFRNKELIDHETRTAVAFTLFVFCCSGIGVFFFLKPIPSSEHPEDKHWSVLRGMTRSFRLLVTPDMLLLTLAFVYTGIHVTFDFGVYGTALGATKAFGEDAKKLVGLHGVFRGLGEIIGSVGLVVLGHLAMRRMDRSRGVIMTVGSALSLISYFLICINIPPEAPIRDTDGLALIPSNKYLAILSSFLLGIGNACFVTQVLALLGSVYRKNIADAVAVRGFTATLAVCAGFIYSSRINLYYQVLLLTVFCVGGNLAFCWVDWKYRTNCRPEGSKRGGSQDRGLYSPCAKEEDMVVLLAEQL